MNKQYDITPWTGAKLAVRVAGGALAILVCCATLISIGSVFISTPSTFLAVLGFGLIVMTIIGAIASLIFGGMWIAERLDDLE